ncbi:MAG: TRAP transporter substrate-binding protein DctP, partial [Marinobacter sp.]
QQGTIDGQENPVNVVHSFKLNETQNYMTLSRHTYAPAIFVMGMPAWSKLPEAAQEVVTQAAQEAAEYERKINAEMASKQLAELREAGMQINDNPDIEAFQAAVAPVYEQYGKQFGDYLPRIQEALK